MTGEPAALFTWNDIVRVLPDAPQQCRPGERAWIVGITEHEKRSGEYLERYPEGTIYTIEFEDGSDCEAEERFLIREIVLDANEWKTKEDFYRELLAELKAPDWHGHNLDALWDSIFTGSINGLNPPFAVFIRGKAQSPEAQQTVERFTDLISEAAAKGRPVSIVTEPLVAGHALTQRDSAT